MPGSATGIVLSTPDARQRELYAALIANDTVPIAAPIPVNLTIGATAVAAGTATASVTITSSGSINIPVRAGQPLEFRHSTGTFLFEVASSSATGSITTINGIAREGVPVGAVAQFPARVGLLLSIDTSETTGTSTFSTFDHDGNSEVARGEGEQSISGSAGASYFNAGLATLKAAQRAGTDVTWLVEQPNPDASAFSAPPYEWGVGVVNDVSSSGGVNDKLQNSIGISVKGGIKTVAPVLAT
jgi:hypothetical protein